VGTAPGGVTDQKKPSSIERIRRLERLERERLEQKARLQERRHQAIAAADTGPAMDGPAEPNQGASAR
jgi:hypothetical protein